MTRRTGPPIVLLAALLLGGCGGSRPGEAVWAMPLGPATTEVVPAGRVPAPLPWLGARGGADAVAAEHGAAAAGGDRGDPPDVGPTGPRAGIWHTDEERAWQQARRTGRPLVVDFSASWCDPCRLMAAQTFRDDLVQAELANGFVPLRIDVTEETRANREQLGRYQVRALPAIVVLDPTGRQLDRIDSFLDAEALLRRLDRARLTASRAGQP